MHTLGPMPRLETERLLLRPFCLYDEKNYYQLATDPDVLFGTDMPHDLSHEATRTWIIAHPDRWQQGRELFLLITKKETREIVGSVSLFTYDRHQKADLGYWIAKEYWGKGFATEACRKVVKYVFEVMKLNRLEANHLARNLTSGNVLEKIGFIYEGLHKESYLKDDSFEDLKFYGLLLTDYKENQHE